LDRNAEDFSDKTIRESDFQKLDREIKKSKERNFKELYRKRKRDLVNSGD
jgi:hypothetical protein